MTRSFNHTGPGQSTDFALPAFARQIVRIEREVHPPVLRAGDLAAKRDFLDVRDVVRAYRLLAERGAGGAVYNVCSGRTHRIGDLLEIMIALSETPITVESVPSRGAGGGISILAGDPSRLIDATGWKPAITIEETVRAVLEFWRRRS